MEIQFCPHCGGRLPGVGCFCPYCGSRFSEAEMSSEAPARAAPTPFEQPQPPVGDTQTPFEQPQPAAAYAPTPDGQPQPPAAYAPAPDGQPQPAAAYTPAPDGQPQPSVGYAPMPYGRPLAGYAATPYGYVPVPTQPPAPRQKKPDDPMARAYRLTTLGTLVTYAMTSQVATAVLSLVGTICAMFLLSGSSLRSFEISDLLENDALVRPLLIAYLFAYVGGLLLGMLVSKTIRRRLPAQPPEQKSLSAAAFLRCALAAFGLWGIGVLIGNFPSFIVPMETMNFGWNAIPTWILAIVVAPIFEELIFRKLVLDRIGSFGETPAVLCSALIFGLAHQNAGQFFLAFLLGILFARIYLHTGKIVYTMLLHFMINFTATLEEVGLLIWGNSFDLWYLIALGVLVLAGIVLLIVCRKDAILGWPGRLSPEDRRRSLRCWPVTLVKWICLATILLYGLLYALLGLADDSFGRDALNPLGLLYLIPAAGAFIFILILTRRPKPQPIPVNAGPIPVNAGPTPVNPDPTPVYAEPIPADDGLTPTDDKPLN